METKLIIGLFHGFGISASIFGAWINWGDWKSGIIFILAALYWVINLVIKAIKGWQEIRRENDRYEQHKRRQS